jgi:Flp pilus assembly protein TadG
MNRGISVTRSRPRSRESGSVFVEFACSFLMLTTMFTGLYQFGYTFYAYNELVSAVRAGARYASLKPYDSTTSTPTDAFKTAVKNVVVYGDPNPPDGATPIVRGLATTNVQLTTAGTGGAGATIFAPSSMTVSITGYQINSVFSSMAMSGRPLATYPYTGILTPPSS